jgi:Bacterial toxin 44
MAQKRYWLTAIVTPASPAITHGETMWLKAYFDENPAQADAGEVTEGKKTNVNPDNFRVPAEKSSAKTLAKSGQQQFDFELSEAEYNSGGFKLYFWVEPYGRAALRKGGLALGRLKLGPSGCKKGGLPNRPPNAMDGDEQIVCEFELVQSVMNFIADEMNTNGKSTDVTKMADLNNKSSETEPGLLWGTKNKYPNAGGEASNLLGCRVHSNASDSTYEQLNTTLQGIRFCKNGWGGEWDHKPRIRPVWGAQNRLGNKGFVYFYDIWSNMHYGYIGAKGGFSLTTLLNGAGKAQVADNATVGGDPPADVEAIKEGYTLGSKKGVSISDIADVVDRNPDWDGRQ